MKIAGSSFHLVLLKYTRQDHVITEQTKNRYTDKNKTYIKVMQYKKHVINLFVCKKLTVLVVPLSAIQPSFDLFTPLVIWATLGN